MMRSGISQTWYLNGIWFNHVQRIASSVHFGLRASV